MKKQQSGFTLIELIAVIVVLGILAAVAVPRFVDLTGAARQASADAVAGNLASASALNYAGAVAVDAGLTATGVQSVTACADTTDLLQGTLSGYTVTGGTAATLGATVECTVTDDNDATVTATFTHYGAP